MISVIAAAEGHRSADADYDAAFCLGVFHGMTVVTGSVMCIPNNVVTVQAVRVMVRYMEARPQKMHEPFVVLALEALQDAWPCRK